VRESPDALQALTEAIGTALRADAAILRFREEGSGDLVARTVWATSRAFSAELVGSRHAPDAGPDPNGSIMRVPIRRGDEVVGELEVMRLGDPFGEDDSSLASSAAAQAGLVLATELGVGIEGQAGRRERELALAGEALALAAGGLKYTGFHTTALCSPTRACLLTGRKLSELRVAVNGAGAAAIACTELIKAMGVRNDHVIMCDRKGVLSKARTDLDQWKSAHAVETDKRTLADAIRGADVFLGLSGADLVSPAMVASSIWNRRSSSRWILRFWRPSQMAW